MNYEIIYQFHHIKKRRISGTSCVKITTLLFLILEFYIKKGLFITEKKNIYSLNNSLCLSI